MAWAVPVRWFKHAGSALYFAAYIVINAQFAIAITISEASIPERIYLDHAATTPIRPEALAAMQQGFAIWANPSSPHAEGRKAKQALEDARERVKKALGWDGEVIFTSGASEALWIALNRAKVDRRIVSAVEHDAVFRAAPDAEVVPIGDGACVDQDQLNDMLARAGRSIVAVQHVNSETGVRQPVSSLAQKVTEAGSLLISDCSQSAGKYTLPDADMIVLSAHKLGGPIGIGALLVSDYNLLEPTGGHERGYRQGTENLPAVLGFVSALEARAISKKTVGTGVDTSAIAGQADWVTVAGLTFVDIEHSINSANGQFQPPNSDWIEHDYSILAISHPTMSAQAQLIRLDAMGFAVSAGSACSSGTLKKSRVLDAFGVSDEVAARTIRVSMGWNSTYDEMQQFAEAWRSLS
ncbi:aminotransferase class V-fold PLP-dependent enzyme [Pontixanthobacter aestiaquae]|uniref:Cysteine desulfurase n=2 Tax=Pontixanthobacter aestiaquae TaxID=1509367 RepID=A0A844ZB38_9SPHN|nr:aminotransferase class V-fold PLP-dependent enzyme [Pontixanthobacter aestiaquae]MDN3645948.1 aminotransferase class V-fold PLP-dependent enzyme [Pontixanthobacter aestiaquae]MXO83059.1 aminotransferase class V-fold PLP-dependent enzyme [Pontixanthobacter aestiaquae]